MPVSNLSSIGVKGKTRSKPIPVHHLIPPRFTAIVKIQIVTDSNTYDITDFIEDGSWTDGATEGIGSFSFKILDPNKTYSNNVSAYDTIKIYIDYGASATTLRFVGRIERSGREDYAFLISGRSEGMVVIGKNINYSATEKKKSDVLKEIIAANFSTVTVTNIEENTSLVNVNYSEVPFVDIINEMNGSTHAFYVDSDLDVHYFEKGTRKNSTEAVVGEINHISTEEYSLDSEGIITKVRVYGKGPEDIPLIATSDSSTSITNGIIKELIIKDNSLITFEQAQERADSEYLLSQTIPKIGSVKSLLLPTIQPGEQIYMFIPMDNIEPNYYNIQSYTHKYPNFETVLTIQQKRINIPKIISKGIVNQSRLVGEPNPNDMDSSIIYDFSSDTGDHSSTEIDTEAQILKTDGSASGTWISPVTTLTSNVTATEVRLKGNKLSGTEVYISLNGGTTYSPTQFSGNKKLVSGTRIVLKVAIKSADTEVKAIGILYKL